MTRLKRKKIIFRLQTKHRVMPTPMDKWNIIIGDKVEVIRGRNEGKQGKVILVNRLAETAVVRGVNLRLHKTTNANNQIRTGWRPSPVLLKHLSLVDQG